MFLGNDLPANFSGNYFYSYAQLLPSNYPSTVGTEVYKFNEALIDRQYLIGSQLTTLTFHLPVRRCDRLTNLSQRSAHHSSHDVIQSPHRSTGMAKLLERMSSITPTSSPLVKLNHATRTKTIKAASSASSLVLFTRGLTGIASP